MESNWDFKKSIVQFSLFQELEKHPAALESLATLVKYQSFQVRDLIINEKLNDDKMYFLLSGQVVINKMDESGQNVMIGKANADQHPFFGESVLLGKFQKSANVVAHSQCECLTLSGKDFETFTQNHPLVVASIYRGMAGVLFDRLSKANRDLFILGTSARR